MSEVVGYELFMVPPRWLFLRVETGDGVVGWGEPVLEGRARTVAAAVSELMDKHVLGADASNIEDTWQLLYRGGFYRGGPVLMSALSGIDQALWDIKGKTLGVSVYDLLGGPCRNAVRVYHWVGGDSPSEVSEEALKLINTGFTAVKMNIAGSLHSIESVHQVKEIEQRVAQVRDAIGDKIDMAIDFHGRVTAAMAPRLAHVLEPYSPLFMEEPILPPIPVRLAQLKASSTIPIAFGERLYTRWEFRPFLEAGVLDVAQPDISHAGGISECKKIGSLLETYGGQMAFHCPLGPIAFASCIQVAATLPNYLIQEASFGMHYNEGIEMSDYLENPSVLELKDGFLPLPSDPGLGIAIDEKAVRDASIKGHDWSNPVWRHEDGALAEW